MEQKPYLSMGAARKKCKTAIRISLSWAIWLGYRSECRWISGKTQNSNPMNPLKCIIVDDEELARTLLENYISKLPT